MGTTSETAVVSTFIPNVDVKPAERQFLDLVFRCEKVSGEETYYFAPDGIPSSISVPLAVLKSWSEDDYFNDMSGIAAALSAHEADTALDTGEEQSAEVEIEPDDVFGVFQQIVGRSSSLRFVRIDACVSYSKYSPGEFGGWACVIWSDDYEYVSTFGAANEIERRLSEAA